MAKKSETIFRKLSEIKDLPTIPEIVFQIMRLIKDPNAGIPEITRYIEEDPVITAKVLQVANSPLYRGAQIITSLTYAASRLGLNEIEKIVLSLSLMKEIKGMTKKEARFFWRHSVSVAFMCDVVNMFSSSPLRSDASERNDLFVGGLLHDIGVLVLKHHFTDLYEQVAIVCEASDSEHYETEMDILGASHAEIGAYLAKNWNLPPSITAMIEFHHEPDRAPDEALRLVQIVNISNFICNNQGMGLEEESVATKKFSETAWWDLGLKVEEIPDMLEEVKRKSQESLLLSAIGV